MQKEYTTEVILDASFVIAYLDIRDKWHDVATSVYNQLRDKNLRFLYLDCVMNEILSVFGKRLEEKGLSQEFRTKLHDIKKLMPKDELIWTYTKVLDWYDEILQIMEKSEGRLNFHDALIALTARELGIKYIASFDKDFDEIKWLMRIKGEERIKEDSESSTSSLN